MSPALNEDTPTDLTRLIPLIKKDNFDLIIIDSIGAALTGDPEAARDICKFFQQLRKLGTCLLLDHQAKKQRGDKSREKTPFGSAYKFNLSRNIWHLNSNQESDNKLNCLLRHTKSNLTSLKSDLGLSFSFDADAFKVESCEPGLELAEHLSIKQQIIIALSELEATAETIAERTGLELGSIRAKLSLLKANGTVEDTGRKQDRATIYQLSTNVNNDGSTRNVNVNTQPRKQSKQKELSETVEIIKKVFPNAEEVPF